MTEETHDHAERIYIREAAELLDRRMGTLRKWEQLNLLPIHLLPHRGHRGWRYWTPDQINGIKHWMKETDRRPGKGLPNYDPGEEEVNQQVREMRRPRKCSICEKPIAKTHHWQYLDGKGVHRACLRHTKTEELVASA